MTEETTKKGIEYWKGHADGEKARAKAIFKDIERNCPIDQKHKGYDIDGIAVIKRKWCE